MSGAANSHVLADDVDLLVIGLRLKLGIDANIWTFNGDRTYTTAERVLPAVYCARMYENDAMKMLRIE